MFFAIKKMKKTTYVRKKIIYLTISGQKEHIKWKTKNFELQFDRLSGIV